MLVSWSPSRTMYTSQALVPHMQLLSYPSLAWLYQNPPLTHSDFICHSLPSFFSTQKTLLSSLPTTYNPHSPSQCSEARHLPSSQGSPFSCPQCQQPRLVPIGQHSLLRTLSYPDMFDFIASPFQTPSVPVSFLCKRCCSLVTLG